MTHISEHTCESAIYLNESASLINEKCNVEYCKLTPEPRVLDAGDYLLLAGLPVPWTFFCTKERQISNPTEGSPYVIIKRTHLCLFPIGEGPYYLQENVHSCGFAYVLYCKYGSCELFWDTDTRNRGN